MNKQYYVYIMGSDRPTLYIGITSNLQKRVGEHKEGKVDGFTKKYGINKLLYFESYDNPETAITREKNLKKWKREWKMRLIQKSNPTLNDLTDMYTFGFLPTQEGQYTNSKSRYAELAEGFSVVTNDSGFLPSQEGQPGAYGWIIVCGEGFLPSQEGLCINSKF